MKLNGILLKILGGILIVITLQGCVPAAFVAGTATGVVIYDHRSTKTILDDRDITFRMQHRLDSDKELRRLAHISVTAFNHIALLVGQAPDTQLRDRAEEIAKTNSKVKMVYNEIVLGKPISDMQCANDAWITTKVKTILLTTSRLQSSTLKVVTENRTVYLMGLTTRLQADLAANAARTVSGVQKVVKLFEYVE